MLSTADTLHPARTQYPYPGRGWNESTNQLGLSYKGPGQAARVLPDGSYENPDPMPSWVDFFGEPLKSGGPLPRSQELYDLPDAYRGSNLLLSAIMINEITSDEAYFTTEVLPWELAPDKLSLQMDFWIFDNHLPDRSPEESANRLLTSQRTQGTLHFQRYGIAFMLEHGFQKTREGILNYAMNIQQIKNSVVEGMCLGVALAILTAPMSPLDKFDTYGLSKKGQLTTREFEKRMQDEIDMFGIVHKEMNGFSVAYDRMRLVMRERGVKNANYMIIPQGVNKYVQYRPEQQMYLYSGKPNDGGPGAGIMGNPNFNVIIRESRPFIMGEKRPNYDPFFRQVTIGGFTHNLAHHLRGVAPEDYRSELRDRFVYDEDQDDEMRITIEQDLRHCGLFSLASSASEDEENSPAHTDASFHLGTDTGPSFHVERHTGGPRPFKKLELTWLGQKYFSRYPNYYTLLHNSGTLDAILKLVACNDTLLMELLNILGEEKHAVLARSRRGKAPKQKQPRPLTRPPPKVSFGAPAVFGSTMSSNPPPATFINPFPAVSAISAPALTSVPTSAPPPTSVPASVPPPSKPDASDDETRSRIYLTQFFATARDMGLWISDDNAKKIRDGFHKYLDIDIAPKVRSAYLWLILATIIGRSNMTIDQFKQCDVMPIEDAQHSGIPPLNPFLPRTETTRGPASSDCRFGLEPNINDTADQLFHVPNLNLQDSEKQLIKQFAQKMFDTICTDDNVDALLPGNQPNVGVDMYKAANTLKQKYWEANRTSHDKMGQLDFEHVDLTSLPLLLSAQYLVAQGFGQDTLLPVYLEKLREKWLVFQNFADTVAKEAVPSTITIEARHVTCAEPDGAITQLTSLGARSDAASLERRLHERLGTTKLGRIREVVRQNMPRFSQLMYEMVVKWDDEKDMEDCIATSLVLTDWLTQCADNKHGPLLKQWATQWLPIYLRQLLTHQGTFRWALDHLDGPRKERNLKLNADAFGNVLSSRFGDGTYYHQLQQLLEANETITTTGTATLIDRARELQAECRDEVEPEEENRCVCAKCPCSCAVANKIREQLVKILKKKPIKEGTLFWWCLKRDLPVPLGFLIFRPMMRYRMGTALLMVPGRSTGSCFFSHSDMQLGSDIVRKLFLGNYTFYAKPAVLQPRNIAYAPNIYCEDYLGGNGTRYFRYDDIDRQNYIDGITDERDMFCCAVPLEYVPDRRFLDITGRYDSSICGGVTDESPYQWPTADIYAEYWGWSHPSTATRPNPDDYTADSVPQYNTICVQDHQRNFLHEGHGRGKFDKVIANRGHWGSRVYAGCGRVRRGVETHLKPVKYEETSSVAIVV